MGGAHSDDDPPEPEVFEDAATGERFLMYTLAAWPGQPRIVYECPRCGERCPAEKWSGVCVVCTGKGKRKRRRDRD